MSSPDISHRDDACPPADDPTPNRTPNFQRNPELEALLDRLNGLLQPAHAVAAAKFTAPRKPVVFVVGGPRSGTTLVMQWLASMGLFGYPSNLVARFYRTPYVGALIHEMLLNPKYRYRDDFADVRPYTIASDFTSDLGKTVGLAAPNVFWYFWRRFFRFDDCPYLDEDKRAGADAAGFVRELAALESAFDKPFALKGLIMNWNVDYLDGLFDKALFIHARRRPACQMASILASRAHFRGDRRHFWGFKPPESGAMAAAASPEEEVAVQIYSTRAAITRAFATMRPERWVTVDYEDFCASPYRTYAAIAQRFAEQDCPLPEIYRGYESFTNNNEDYRAVDEALGEIYTSAGRRFFSTPDS